MALKRTLSSASGACTATAERTTMYAEPMASEWSSFDEEDPFNEEDGLLIGSQLSDSDGFSNAMAKSPWLGRHRVVEFAVSTIIILISGAVALMPVHIRAIPSLEVTISHLQTVYSRDPTLSSRQMPETVTTAALVVGTTSIPILVNLYVNFRLPKLKPVRVIPHDTRDFLLSLLQSIGISQVLTQFIKNLTGRFRPSFYDMCKWNYDVVWDGKTNLCQDEKWEKEARLSFPSGHASYAWCTLFLLTLYLLGRLRLNSEAEGDAHSRGRKILKLFLCFLPTMVATWVAITRSVDNWHHYGDILAGSIIGALAAGFSYSYNYSSVFHWELAGVPLSDFHVRRTARRSVEKASTDDTIAITIK